MHALAYRHLVVVVQQIEIVGAPVSKVQHFILIKAETYPVHHAQSLALP